EKYDVRLRIPKDERDSLVSIGRIVFTDERGNSVPLNRLVKISEVNRSAGLMRINRRDAFYVTVAGKTGDKEQAARFIETMLKKYPNMKSVSSSVFLDYLPSIILTFSVALLLLYLFLGAQFESFIEPLILLAALPLSLIGVIPMLILGGSSLNLNSALGILVLFGISVNNSIVLKNTIKHRTGRTGKADINTIVAGSAERLRPILITTITTIAALIPTAFNIFGESPQSSLALAVIGGLAVSSLLILFVIPAVSLKGGMKSALRSTVKGISKRDADKPLKVGKKTPADEFFKEGFKGRDS
ncbi:MAG: efflux RND transporter permease subunit, partial [Spirochaetales bacterium]|nr:efflux RND transporter permease subunit [Spirochaetales bacterium]